jgi:hypothetical protein
MLNDDHGLLIANTSLGSVTARKTFANVTDLISLSQANDANTQAAVTVHHHIAAPQQCFIGDFSFRQNREIFRDLRNMKTLIPVEVKFCSAPLQTYFTVYC